MAFSLPTFRTLYPEFDDIADLTVTATASQADCYVPTVCSGPCGDAMLMAMVAHLLSLRASIAAGGGRAVQSATEGSVSVSMAAPSDGRARALWLNGTPYGQQYAALEQRCLSGKAAAGRYFGVLSEQAAFRRVGGVFR